MAEVAQGRQPPGKCDEVKARFDRALLIQAVVIVTLCIHAVFTNANLPRTRTLRCEILSNHSVLFSTMLSVVCLYFLYCDWPGRHFNYAPCRMIHTAQFMVCFMQANVLHQCSAPALNQVFLLAVPFLGMVHLNHYYNAIRGV